MLIPSLTSSLPLSPMPESCLSYPSLPHSCLPFLPLLICLLWYSFPPSLMPILSFPPSIMQESCLSVLPFLPPFPSPTAARGAAGEGEEHGESAELRQSAGAAGHGTGPRPHSVRGPAPGDCWNGTRFSVGGVEGSAHTHTHTHTDISSHLISTHY